MKRFVVAGGIGVAVVTAILVLGGLRVYGETKGEAITAKGEVVDLWCYVDHDARGPGHKECAIACAKAGNPIGLVTEKGDVYVLMGGEKHQPGSAVALDKMAETVTVTGTLVKKGGIQVIYVKSVK
jgi:hypothetical protein